MEAAKYALAPSKLSRVFLLHGTPMYYKWFEKAAKLDLREAQPNYADLLAWEVLAIPCCDGLL